jgi:hypothetical protein
LNTDNLQEGHTYKNYKELCEVLDEKLKDGNSKKAQLMEWTDYFDYERDGRKFTITKIHCNKISHKQRQVLHIKLIEELILDYLVSGESEGEKFISRMDLMLYLNMVKDEYRSLKPKRGKLSEASGIPTKYINDFYQSTHNLLKRNIETALNDLKNRSLIFWQDAIAVCYLEQDKEKLTNIKRRYKDSYGDIVEDGWETLIQSWFTFREATKEEYGYIADTERKIMKELGFRTKTGVFLSGQYVKFRCKVNDLLYQQHNIVYYFPAYRILFSNDVEDMEEYIEEIEQYFLMPDEEEEKQMQLNQNTVERIKKSIQKKYKNKTDPLRQDKRYLTFNNKLINDLIDKKKNTYIRSAVNNLPKHKRKKLDNNSTNNK